MLAVSVEFLRGVFRGDPEGTANTDRLTSGEWPPSPARLFAALVAADGTGDRTRVTDGSELSWLEALPPPVIHADARPCHQRIKPRYVVRQVRRGRKLPEATQQEYVARMSALHRAGVSVAPRDPRVVFVWCDASPDEAILDGLRRRAGRVGYVGGSDSPARVRVDTQMPADAPADRFVPDPKGDVRISVTRPGTVEALDRLYEAWVEHGASVSRAQFPTLQHRASYRSPGPQSVDRGAVAAWLLLRPSVPGRRVAAVSAVFKAAVLKCYQRMFGEPPAVLHGHGFSGKGYELACFLPLPDVGHAHAKGRIHGLALWLPPSSDSVIRRRSGDAARAINRLAGPGVEAEVVPRGGERRPWAAHPERWCPASRRWVTAFPAIHERRRTLDLDELSRWCRHAGLPAPVAFRSTRSPLLRGGVDLAPVEVNRPGRPALPYSHVELLFDEPVAGPVVIGSGRSRGFGLCAPVEDGEGSVRRGGADG